MTVRLDNITKTFPGVKALDRVCFEILPGDVHALCGENGAGKSTLMKVLSGIYAHGTYEGRILRRNGAAEQELTFNGVGDALAAGISIVHQELALMPDMTVLDNLFLGREPGRWGRLDKRRQRALAREHLEALGLTPHLDTKVGALSVGWQQRLEIARALLDKPSVLVLDEPTSALPEDDAARLLEWIRELSDNGTACVYISHRMEEVCQIADRVTVLRDGRSVWTKPVSETDIGSVVQAMVDRPPTDMYAHEPLAPGDRLLQVTDLRVRRAGRCILSVPRLDIRRGEIVGLAGLMGAGRTCLLRALAGALDHVKVEGRFRDAQGGEGALPRHPAQAMRHGLFLIPEDRKVEALFLDESVTANTTAANTAAFRRLGRIDRGTMRQHALDRIDQFGVKAPSPDAAVRTLSGGNQQKVLLCRAAEVNPGILLLDEPTRGIDVGAKESIYRQMEAWAREGWGILWSSSELQELLGISDRLYVLADGRIGGTLSERPFSEHEVMACATTQQGTDYAA